ncbi:Gfo/Idh/MocA family protein [Cohnella hongkongensis]|uniref:Gfo/Idh/MocA family protein n=1 Tax=Cohnella hongkongensis TaxID=178337 RepID=A0ABV9F5Y6_9BACL
MSRRLRVGVVGLGRVSKSHLPAFRELRDIIELTALVSRDREKLLEEAVKWEALKQYVAFEDALADPDIDAFLLLLPHHLHASYTIKALRAGKHVLVEKPMALNEEEAASMVEAAEQGGVTLMVGQSRRFFEPVIESIRLLRQKQIGDLISINGLLLAHMDKPAVSWWQDKAKIGGFMIPLWGSHLLDYVVWAFGEMPVSVYAQGYSNNPNWEGEDEVSISLKFARGRMANLLLSFNAGARPTDEDGLTGKRIWSTSDSIYERYLIGSNGMMRLQDEYQLYLNSESVTRIDKDGRNFVTQLREFAEAIMAGRQPLASGRDVLGVTKIMDACFVSMKENRVVHLS